MSLAAFALSIRNGRAEQKPTSDGGFPIPWQIANSMSAQAAGCKTRRNGVMHRHRFLKSGELLRLIEGKHD